MDYDGARAELTDIRDRLENITDDIQEIVNSEVMGDALNSELIGLWDALSNIAAHIGGMEPDTSFFVEPHSDDAAIDRFAAKMKAKMRAGREAGRGGWDDPAHCSVEKLQGLLGEHLRKGDPVDVANFSMMISHYGGSTV